MVHFAPRAEDTRFNSHYAIFVFAKYTTELPKMVLYPIFVLMARYTTQIRFINNPGFIPTTTSFRPRFAIMNDLVKLFIGNPCVATSVIIKLHNGNSFAISYSVALPLHNRAQRV